MSAGSGANTRLRLVGLDGLRGILALCVIIVHTTAHFSPSILAILHVELLGQAIVVFFVMSGLLIYMPFARTLITAKDPLSNVAGYTRARLLRVFPAYIVIFLLANAFAAVYVENAMKVQERGAGGGTGTITDPVQLFWHLTLLQNYLPSELQTGINSSWTLTVELAFYLLLPLLVAVTSALSTRVTGTAARYLVAAAPAVTLIVIGTVSRIVLAQVAASSGVSPEMSEWGPYPIAVLTRSILPWADNFGWGMLAVVFYIAVQRAEIPAATIVRVRRWAWPVGAFALALSGVFYFVQPRYIGGAFALFSVALLVLLTVPIDGRMQVWRVARWVDTPALHWIGTISLSVYLLHYPVILVLERCGVTGGDTWAGWAWNFVLVSAVSIAIGSITYLLVERPAMRLASRKKR